MTKERKDLLVFGYGLSLILSFFGIRHGMKYGFSTLSIVLLIVAAGFALISLIRVELLRAFYKKWMVGAHFIGRIFTCLILSLLFYIIFSGAGIVLRLLKKDLLDEHIDCNQDSYWIKRPEVNFDKTTYNRQF